MAEDALSESTSQAREQEESFFLPPPTSATIARAETSETGHLRRPSSSETVEADIADPAPAMPSRAIYPLGWTRRNVQRGLALFAAGLATLWFLVQVSAILPPFLLAFFLAALLDPTCRAMEQHGRSRVRAILTIYAAALCLLAILFLFVARPAFGQIQELSAHFSDDYNAIQNTADLYIKTHSGLFTLLGIRQHHLQDILNQSLVKDKIAAALGAVTLFVSSLASKAIWLIIIPVATFFLMRDYPMLRARAIALFPEPYQDHIDAVSREIVDVFSAYLRGLAKICLLYGFAAFVLFSLLGVRYALFLGIMAGAFYAVPYLGQLFTALSSGSVAYLMSAHVALLLWHVPEHSTAYALVVALCAVVAQNLFDQLIYPRVVGASVGLHPVVSIFALASGATLLGVWGILIAVPVAASLQIILTLFFPKLIQTPPARFLVEPKPLA